MKVIAIDATGTTASVAIIENKKCIVELTVNDKLTHSQTLLPLVAEAFSKANLTINDMDYIAASIGPGSFTGLRIGAATAKGLALPTNKRVVPVPTLDALAYTVFETENIICPIMDARRNQVYSCFYTWEQGGLVPLSKMMAEDIDTIIEKAKSFDKKVIFVGDGVFVHEEVLSAHENFVMAPAHCRLQSGASVASLAVVLAEKNMAIDSKDLELIYLRKSQAEREREERMLAEMNGGDA
ncbi:MAG: tRNA (adenosine(37)-N6)-threonylcarbamoyltransferase complex dimerization subunit type 1 TsaB [Bacillota bacterium]